MFANVSKDKQRKKKKEDGRATTSKDAIKFVKNI